MLKTMPSHTPRHAATRPGRSAVLCLAAALLAAPAAAQTLVDATGLDRILTIAQGYGEAALEEDSGGDPMISGQIEQTNYVVFFYGCTDGADCSTIQFRARYTGADNVDLDLLNGWNAEKRWGKAYLNSDGETVFEMDVNLWSGVHENNLNDTFDWWRVMIEGFEEYIEFEHAEDDDPVTTEAPVTREAGTDATPVGNPTAQGIGAGTLGGGAKVKVNR